MKFFSRLSLDNPNSKASIAEWGKEGYYFRHKFNNISSNLLCSPRIIYAISMLNSTKNRSHFQYFLGIDQLANRVYSHQKECFENRIKTGSTVQTLSNHICCLSLDLPLPKSRWQADGLLSFLVRLENLSIGQFHTLDRFSQRTKLN